MSQIMFIRSKASPLEGWIFGGVVCLIRRLHFYLLLISDYRHDMRNNLSFAYRKQIECITKLPYYKFVLLLSAFRKLESIHRELYQSEIIFVYKIMSWLKYQWFPVDHGLHTAMKGLYVVKKEPIHFCSIWWATFLTWKDANYQIK